MKYILIFLLFVVPISLRSQNEIKADSIDHKKNFFILNGSYLYNTYHGRQQYIYPATLQSSSTSGPSPYTEFKYINTSGGNLNVVCRHFFTRHISIQNGIRLNYKTKIKVHNDSLKNENNSQLKTGKTTMFIGDYCFYFNYHIKQFAISSGMIFPILMHSYYSQIYRDKSVKKYDHRFQFINPFEFYLSENIQYQPFKKTNLIISIGIDVSQELIFQKNSNGYLIAFNCGVGCFFEKKNNQRRQVDDYNK